MSSSRRLQERDVYIPPGRRNRTTTTASTTQPGGNELGKGRSVFSFSETGEAAGTKTVTASTEQGTDAGVGNPSSGNSRKAAFTGYQAIYVPRGRKELMEREAGAQPQRTDRSATATATASEISGSTATATTAKSHPAGRTVTYTGCSTASTTRTNSVSATIGPIKRNVVEAQLDDSSSGTNSARNTGRNSRTTSFSSSAAAAAAAAAATAAPDLYRQYVREAQCLLLSCVEPISDIQRDNFLKPLAGKGVLCQWCTPKECVLVGKEQSTGGGSFNSSSGSGEGSSRQLLDTVRQAMAAAGSTAALTVRPFSELPQGDLAVYMAVANDLFHSYKPERSSAVANRLIGAALGIRMKAPQARSQSSDAAAAGSVSSRPSKSKAPTAAAVETDSWDS